MSCNRKKKDQMIHIIYLKKSLFSTLSVTLTMVLGHQNVQSLVKMIIIFITIKDLAYTTSKKNTTLRCFFLPKAGNLPSLKQKLT